MRLDPVPGQCIRLARSGSELVVDDPALSDALRARFGHLKGDVHVRLTRESALIFAPETGARIAVSSMTIRFEASRVLCVGITGPGGPIGMPAATAPSAETQPNASALQETDEVPRMPESAPEKERQTSPALELALRDSVSRASYEHAWARAVVTMTLRRLRVWDDRLPVDEQRSKLGAAPGSAACREVVEGIFRVTAAPAGILEGVRQHCEALTKTRGPLRAWAKALLADAPEEGGAGEPPPGILGKDLSVHRVRELLASGKLPAIQNGLALLDQLMRNRKGLAENASKNPAHRKDIAAIGDALGVAAASFQSRTSLQRDMGETQRAAVRGLRKALLGKNQREVAQLVRNVRAVHARAEEIARSKGEVTPPTAAGSSGSPSPDGRG